MKGTKGRGKERDKWLNTIVDGSAEQAMLRRIDELTNLVKDLAAKLDADTGVTDTDYSTTFESTVKDIDLYN